MAKKKTRRKPAKKKSKKIKKRKPAEKTKVKTICIRLTEGELDAIQDMADRICSSRASVIRMLIKAGLENPTGATAQLLGEEE